MTKKHMLFVPLSLIALVVGLLGAYIISNVNEKPAIVVQQKNQNPNTNAESPTTYTIVHSTVFEGVDAVHWGKGTANITTNQDGASLVFKDDFEVAQGPDLFVYLSPNPAGEELGEFASLGNIKSNKGIQEYTLPNNYEDYKTIVIWCRAIGVTFATAKIN